MPKLDVGVIGVGHLGALHGKMYSQIGSANLVGIYDIDAAKAKQVADELSTKAFGSIEELIDASDAVSVVTTTLAHYDAALKALRQGVHTFIEKPITETIEQAQSLVREAADRKLKIQVGHIERFNPAILALESYEIKPLFIE
ncbi:MAG TPA: Gfo/Idh/MocA family oxidoreductase, partial [Terriglobia bacterium]|nr:Gfo/Idh/MocA family oxidoreductase [Terriglobia bacterium]